MPADHMLPGSTSDDAVDFRAEFHADSLTGPAAASFVVGGQRYSVEVAPIGFVQPNQPPLSTYNAAATPPTPYVPHESHPIQLIISWEGMA